MKRAPYRSPDDPNIYHDDDCADEDVAFVIDDAGMTTRQVRVESYDAEYSSQNHGVWLGASVPDVVLFLPDKVVERIIAVYQEHKNASM